MNFSKRKTEVEEKLTLAKASMTAYSSFALKDTEVLKAAVTQYFINRDKVLEDALLFLSDESYTPRQQRDRWDSHFTTKGTDAARCLNEAMKAKAETPYSNIVRDLISEERVFFLKLLNTEFCDVMYARVIMYKKQYYDEKQKLKDKWSSLTSENKNINVAIAEASEKIIELYRNSLTKAGTAKDLIRNQISAWLPIAATIFGAVTKIEIPDAIIQTVTSTADNINLIAPDGKELSSRLQALHKSEENVAVFMFGATRKSVKEFLENTNHDKAEKDYYTAYNQAKNIAVGMLTDGQRLDAAYFVERAQVLTKLPLTSFTDAYNGFVNEYKGIFIGMVGERTIVDLLRKDESDERKARMERLNVQEELKRLYDDSRDWVNIDGFEFTPERKALVIAELKKIREKWDLALSKAGDRDLISAIMWNLRTAKEVGFANVKNI